MHQAGLRGSVARYLFVIAHDSASGRAAKIAIARRDFLYVATGAFVGMGVLAATWPFIDQMNPGADVLSAGSPLGVDLSSLQPGQQVVVRWRSRPIFIVYRTPASLAALKSVSHRNRLRDPDSEERQQPAYAVNEFRSVRPKYLVVVGICTHLGCIPTFSPIPDSVEVGWKVAISATAMVPNTIWLAACLRMYLHLTICPCHPTALRPRTASPSAKTPRAAISIWILYFRSEAS